MSKIGGNLLTLWKWGEVRKCRLENYSHTGSFPLDYKPINCKASFVIGFLVLFILRGVISCKQSKTIAQTRG